MRWNSGFMAVCTRGQGCPWATSEDHRPIEWRSGPETFVRNILAFVIGVVLRLSSTTSAVIKDHDCGLPVGTDGIRRDLEIAGKIIVSGEAYFGSETDSFDRQMIGALSINSSIRET